MDAKDLRTEPVLSERNSDGNTNYASSGVSFQCADKNKSYHEIGSNSLPKVDLQTTRPCAVIGPDRIVPQPHPAVDPFIKHGLVEPWQLTRPPEYHKLPDYQHQLVRNISPRQTFQENMPRIMVPPIQYNPAKVNEAPAEKNSSVTKNTKLTMPSEPKYCEVPYTVNPLTNEPKSVRNTDLPAPSGDPVLARSAPQVWPPSGINMRPPRGYGPSELYHYPDYSSCAAPRTLPINRSHRPGHEEPLPMYPDSYYRGGNIRFEPYPTVKDRYQPPRYDYITNYANPYNPPHFPAHKHDMQKLPSSAMPSHPYPGYSQVPLKYLEKMREPLRDSYQRSPTQTNYGVPFHNQGMHPNYGPVPGNCLPNKLYTYPTDTAGIPDPHSKSPYETNKSYMPSKHYPTPNNYFLNELPGSHMKPQMVMANYPAMNMHPVPPYPYYRKENMSYKNYDFPMQYKNADPLYNNTQLQRIPSQFSPNIISPVESNTSNDHAFSVSPEDCGYVSQSSTTSIRSTDSAMSRYRVYNPRYGYMIRGSPLASRVDSDSKTMSSKDKKNIDLRQFLQSWNEGDDEHSEGNPNKEALHPNSSDPKRYEVVNNQEQLYVLGLVNVPSEELGKYEHIQKVSKLPDNIKGYTSIDLLNQFEEAIESSKVNNSYATRAPEETKTAIKANAHLPSDRPISPLDVEAKISQSVIHKEVGCNFELRLCSPKMMNVEVASSAQNVLGERVIEKVTNPLIVESPSMMPNMEENCSIVKRQNRRRSLNREEPPNISSCKMVKTQYSVEIPESKKSDYSIQDLESNSGVCLASLPRLDNDIELSFPEVNQQFINANKVEPTTSTLRENFPPLDINETASFTSKHANEIKDARSYPYSPSEEFSKLSKYRRIKSNKESIDEKPTQPVRTDSVIIKNPENSENITMAEEKLNPYLNKRPTPGPMNLAMGSPVDTDLTELSETTTSKSASVDTIGETQTFNTEASSSENVIHKANCEKETKHTEDIPTDLSSTKNYVTKKDLTQETDPPLGIKHNRRSLSKNDSGYNDPDCKLDDDEEVLSLEQERRRQSLSLEARLTPLSEDTSSETSETESDDGETETTEEIETSRSAFTKMLHRAGVKECLSSVLMEDINSSDANIDDLSTTEESNPKLLPNDNNSSNGDSKKAEATTFDALSESEIKVKPDTCNEVCQKLPEIQQKSTSLNGAINENSELERQDNPSDDSDCDSLSDSETSSSGSTSDAEEFSNTDDDIGETPEGNSNSEDLDTSLKCPATNELDSAVSISDLLPNADGKEEKPSVTPKTLNGSSNKRTEDIEFATNGLESTDSISDRLPNADGIEEKQNVTPKSLSGSSNKTSDDIELPNPDQFSNQEKIEYVTNVETEFNIESTQIGKDVSSKIHTSRRCCDVNSSLFDEISAPIDSGKKDDSQVDEDQRSVSSDLEHPTKVPTDKDNCKNAMDVIESYDLSQRISRRKSITFHKELFCAAFQHLILEEGLMSDCKLKRRNTISEYATNKSEHTLQSQERDQESSTDLVEENLERMHASNASVQNSSNETEEQCSNINFNESDSVSITDCDKSEANGDLDSFFREQKNETVSSETEDLLSSLIDEPQHDKDKHSVNEYTSKNVSCKLKFIASPINMPNNFVKADSDSDQPKTGIKNYNVDITQCTDDNSFECSDSVEFVSIQSDKKNLQKEINENCQIVAKLQNDNDSVTQSQSSNILESNSSHQLIPPSPSNSRDEDSQTVLELQSDNVCEDADVLETSISCQPEDTSIPPTLTENSEVLYENCQTEPNIHNVTDNVTYFEDDAVFEESVSYETDNIATPSILSKEESCDTCHPEPQPRNIICEKCSLQREQYEKNINFNLNNARGCLRTTKRSLSESAIYSNSHYTDKNNVKLEECWSKRRKVADVNQVTNSPFLTSENISNLIQSRRNSVSSFYHDENVSFCILIDNDCIIAQDEFDQDAICFADIPEENFSTVVDNHILAVNEEPRTTIPLDHSSMDDVIVPLSPEKTVEESWVEDVACVETVVSEDVVDDCNEIYDGISEASPNCDDGICDSEKSDLNMFSTNDHAEKIKHIYGNEICSSQSIDLIKTLYTTPQMDVNKTLHYTESLVLESTNQIDHVETEISIPTTFEEPQCDSKLDEVDTNSNFEPLESVQENNCSDDVAINDADNATKESGSFGEVKGSSDIMNKSEDYDYGSDDVAINDADNATKENASFEEVKGTSDILNKSQDDVVLLSESSIDEVFYSRKTVDNPEYKRSSSSPEVSSTTEEKKSGIFLKITNFNGSRISHINDMDVDSNRRIRCKFTEENDYRSNLTSSRPLITKAAQKYIPPLKETTINDLKVKLFLPERSLLKLKNIKMSKEQPKMDVQKQNNSKINCKTSKVETNKKPKPKFEDVLKSIDEIQIKMHKERNRKVDKIIPKVIIKKNGNGSHYASSSTREVFNPDMTGRKWQPWVFLEKHKFIDKMAKDGKTRAIFCHRKKTYILVEHFKKYRSVGSTKFIISQPKPLNSPAGPLKYTIKLKQV